MQNIDFYKCLYYIYYCIEKSFLKRRKHSMETYGIEKFGIIGPKAVYRNLSPAQLTEAALRLGEGSLSNTGALVVTTGNEASIASIIELLVPSNRDVDKYISDSSK